MSQQNFIQPQPGGFNYIPVGYGQNGDSNPATGAANALGMQTNALQGLLNGAVTDPGSIYANQLANGSPITLENYINAAGGFQKQVGDGSNQLFAQWLSNLAPFLKASGTNNSLIAEGVVAPGSGTLDQATLARLAPLFTSLTQNSTSPFMGSMQSGASAALGSVANGIGTMQGEQAALMQAGMRPGSYQYVPYQTSGYGGYGGGGGGGGDQAGGGLGDGFLKSSDGSTEATYGNPGDNQTMMAWNSNPANVGRFSPDIGPPGFSPSGAKTWGGGMPGWTLSPNITIPGTPQQAPPGPTSYNPNNTDLGFSGSGGYGSDSGIGFGQV